MLDSYALMPFELIMKNRTHHPVQSTSLVDGVKRLESFESTWQIEDFSCDQVLIPSNIRGHSKLSSKNVEQPTLSPKQKRVKIGDRIGSKPAGFVVGSDSIVTLTQSLFQRDNIVAFCLKEAVSLKNQRFFCLN